MVKLTTSITLGCCLVLALCQASAGQELTPEQRAFMGLPATHSGHVPESPATGVQTRTGSDARLDPGPETPAALPGGPPMTFRTVGTGGANCCEWIAADGVITLETPQAFKDFLSGAGKNAATSQKPVTFNSPGGDFFAALALGREIRRNTRLWTAIGRTEAEPSAPGRPKAYRVSDGVCLSACVLSFMGGRTRIYERNGGVSGGAALAFQAFALDQPASVLGRPSADAMSSAGLPSPGILRLLMEGYATEMGIDPAILPLMETTGQPGGLHLVTQEEADRMGLNTPVAARTKWTLAVKREGLVLYGAGEDRWTHYSVGLQCARGGTMEYAMAVPAPPGGGNVDPTEEDYRNGIRAAFLRGASGATMSVPLASVRLLKGNVLMVTASLDANEVSVVAKDGADIQFETAEYLSHVLPKVSLASRQIAGAVPLLLRNCPAG